MRKFLLFLCALSFSFTGFSQTLVNSQDAPDYQEAIDLTVKNNQSKAGGDIIWQTTFDWADESAPTGWTLPEGWENVDLTDFANHWIWRKDSTRGYFTRPFIPSGFDTPEDGFLCMPIDEYNYRDEVRSYDECDAYITTPPIDCSAAPSVVVKFNQLWRYCCSGYNLEMMVTNDGGVHWATYDAKFGVAGNTVTPVRYRSPEINISDVAAGMSAVQIRFYIHGPRLYYWMIDDLRLTEAYENDLVLEDTWANFNDGNENRIGHINYWPISQLGQALEEGGHVGDYQFAGALLNNGMSDQYGAQIELSVLRNGSEVYHESSPTSEIWTLDRDTLTVNTAFLAEEYGDYQFNYSAVSENDEDVPASNAFSLSFTVNDSLFHRPDFSAESSASTGGWVGGNNAGDMVGVGYDVFEACEIDAITAYLYSRDETANPQFQYILMQYLPEEDIFIERLTSEIVDFEDGMQHTWHTMPLDKDGESEFLEPGFYVACVKMWGEAEDDEDGICGMRIGWDKDNKHEGWYTYMWQEVSGEWYGTGKMNMIGMIINNHDGPQDAPITFNVDMNAHIQNGEFYPNNDYLDVAGSFNDWSGSDPMDDSDTDGIYTLQLPTIPIAHKIEYNYRINGNWETAEYQDTENKRTHTIRYYNVLNDVYNGGRIAGTDAYDLNENLAIYPNPSSGEFTVEFVQSQSADIKVKVINLQGQEVYSSIFPGSRSFKQTIRNDFKKGIYFLLIEAGNYNQSRKLIIN